MMENVQAVSEIISMYLKLISAGHSANKINQEVRATYKVHSYSQSMLIKASDRQLYS